MNQGPCLLSFLTRYCICLSTYFWPCWLFIAALGLSLVATPGFSAQAPHYVTSLSFSSHSVRAQEL